MGNVIRTLRTCLEPAPANPSESPYYVNPETIHVSGPPVPELPPRRPPRRNQQQENKTGAISKPNVKMPASPGPLRKPDLVIAIDFGTTYTGYAFSFRHEYIRDAIKISTNMWPHNNGMSIKAPTAILLRSDGSVVAFGYEACQEFANICERGQINDFYFFHRFKMDLYLVKNLTKETMLNDVMGRQLKALFVFRQTIAYLKDHVTNMISSRDSSLDINKLKVQWVLTIPAIWSDKSKQFMRMAALEAGIKQEQLILALEPEAAALYCRYVPVYNSKPEEDGVYEDIGSVVYRHFRPGTKYMIVDIGGGTVDVTIQEIQSNGAVAELHVPSGGYWGGTKVDAQFQALLETVFSRPVLQNFQDECSSEVLEMLNDFEMKKRTYKITQDADVHIKIPAALLAVMEEKTGKTAAEFVKATHLADSVSVKRDKLVIKHEFFYSFFHEPISSIVSHLVYLQEHGPSGVETCLLVGGFSEAEVVRDTICQQFPGMRLISPEDASMAVLKGAVLFGHEPDAIRSRVSKYTYGVAIQRHFKPDVDPPEKKITIDNQELCDDIFDIHIKVGEVLSTHEEVPKKEYKAPGELILLDVYASSDPCPRFVTEDSCFALGHVIVEVEKNDDPSRKILVQLQYKGTELGVTALDSFTKRVTKAYFNFI